MARNGPKGGVPLVAASVNLTPAEKRILQDIAAMRSTSAGSGEQVTLSGVLREGLYLVFVKYGIDIKSLEAHAASLSIPRNTRSLAEVNDDLAEAQINNSIRPGSLSKGENLIILWGMYRSGLDYASIGRRIGYNRSSVKKAIDMLRRKMREHDCTTDEQIDDALADLVDELHLDTKPRYRVPAGSTYSRRGNSPEERVGA